MKFFALTGFLVLGLSVSYAADIDNGYNNWNIQVLYGNEFREPFNPRDTEKTLITIENSSGWKWGNSFAFIDIAKSDSNDKNAMSAYGEWYPSASLAKITDRDISFGIINDISLTAGINAGRKSTGASPLVYLPGITLDISLPDFVFFNLGIYAYIDQGKVNNGQSNRCHKTGIQVSPAWLLPFSISKAKLHFAGFVDYISSHGECSEQILAQPRISLDFGNLIGMAPNHIFAGVEYQYWHNKFGINNLNENFPQALLMYKF